LARKRQLPTASCACVEVVELALGSGETLRQAAYRDISVIDIRHDQSGPHCALLTT
jgi:hypothetical protein